MNPEDKLFEVADRQQGYFTSQQAEVCGISRSNFHFRIRSGEWVKELRGIYRLARYPMTNRSELVLWVLWSRDRKGNPQGVWSHETALDIHEMSDVMPSKMHMTVPPSFRKRVPIPKHLKLRYATLIKSDKETWQGYQVTTPLRTLIDVIEEGIIPEEQIEQAIRDGLRIGILNERDLNKTSQLKKYSYLYVHKYKIQKRN
ncbi:MAG: type IV toxin-antitoxin system AbiEi family antitoxin domain-containing protein [Verrucomicrobiota bacterium]|nr:type IV toxin-antitoxin system AbiEi family antitoxin domain-containing protein [Verrucomicrobiota bacterium]